MSLFSDILLCLSYFLCVKCAQSLNVASHLKVKKVYTRIQVQECLYFVSLLFIFFIKCTFLSISRVAEKNHVDKVKRKRSPRPHYYPWAKPSTPSCSCETAQWSTDQSLFVLGSLQEWHCASVISNISKKHTLTLSNNYLKKLNIKILKKCTLTCRNQCPYISLTLRVSVASLFHFNSFVRYKEKWDKKHECVSVTLQLTL